ncbi:MAG: hypothetical protein MZW92_19090 [Comamonadaceae bacterium]|nr:hypothetical protein [Comamonadaceae bacterium]
MRTAASRSASAAIEVAVLRAQPARLAAEIQQLGVRRVPGEPAVQQRDRLVVAPPAQFVLEKLETPRRDAAHATPPHRPRRPRRRPPAPAAPPGARRSAGASRTAGSRRAGSAAPAALSSASRFAQTLDDSAAACPGPAHPAPPRSGPPRARGRGRTPSRRPLWPAHPDEADDAEGGSSR